MDFKVYTDELIEKIDSLLKEKEYKQILELMNENKDLMVRSNELSYFFYICNINREEILETNKPVGLLKYGTVRDAVRIFMALKRQVQRACYCEEFDAMSVLDYMTQIGAGANELLWLVNTSTIDPDLTLRRIKNETGPTHEPDKMYVSSHDPKGSSVDFIICSNDDDELNEAIYYINRLYIPDGVRVDLLSIEGAKSMCAGNNEGMRASKAKYKVYMHHDVRITDRFFIAKMIDYFMDHEDTGLMGMIGTRKFPKDGKMWNVNRYGALYETHIQETVSLTLYKEKKDVDAVVCDGLLLATQYDVPWREDVFDGWDHYDTSQCMEFLKKGYKVGIPYMEKPWCLHDCGFLSLGNYDKYKDLFLKEYSDMAAGL